MKNKFFEFIKIFLIALFLEIIIFNITSYRNIFGKYKKIEYTIDNITYIGIDEGRTIIDTERVIINFTKNMIGK